MSHEQYMERCTALAREAAQDGCENGIAAIIVIDGEIIAEGVNEVQKRCDPTRHAEIVAIGSAAQAIGKPNLSGATLYSSLQPCEMCLSAAAFAQISTVIFAATKENVAAKYFMFPALKIEQFSNACVNDLQLIGGLMEDDVLDLYVDGQE